MCAKAFEGGLQILLYNMIQLYVHFPVAWYRAVVAFSQETCTKCKHRPVSLVVPGWVTAGVFSDEFLPHIHTRVPVDMCGPNCKRLMTIVPVLRSTKKKSKNEMPVQLNDIIFIHLENISI